MKSSSPPLPQTSPRSLHRSSLRVVPYFVLFLIFIVTSLHAQEGGNEISGINKQIESIRAEVSPANGLTEDEVLQGWGTPRGRTTPEKEKQHGAYDKDELGLYRWFFEEHVRGTEKATGLATVFTVEMVVYFIDGRAVGSTLQITPPLGQRYVSADGVILTFAGSPPVLRRGKDGTLAFDYHTAEGELQTRKKLLTMLERYKAQLSNKK